MLLEKQTAEKLRHLYETSSAARYFFERAAERKNDVADTKLSKIAEMAEVTYGQALALANELSDAGCGKLILGRKGYETRFRWDLSLPSLGKVAKGQQAKATRIDPEVKEDAGLHRLGIRSLTIPQAKRLLADSLGISEDKIEITIRG